MRFVCALVAALAVALPAIAADWTGTWVGGTTALGSAAFVQVEIEADGAALRGSFELPSEDALQPLRDIDAKEDSIAFKVPSPFGEFRFAGSREGDVIRGRVKTPMGTEAAMHLVRSSAPRSSANGYVGTYRLPDGNFVITMARPRGQLRSVATGSLASLRLVPMGGDRFVDGASVVEDPAKAREIQFARDANGNVSAVENGGVTALRVEVLTQENVTFRNGDLVLGGTLMRPKSTTGATAVVVHGSGATSRDALLLRAQLLLRMGIAVFLYDKRGTGESGGNWRTASLEDLASDAAAAIGYLRSRADIDAKKIGLVGHSQAGWIIPIVAGRDPKLAFAIVASGGGLSPQEQELFRAEVQTRKDSSAEDAQQAKQLTALMWNWAKTGAGWDDYQNAWLAASKKPWFRRIGGPRTPDDPSWQQVRLFAAYDPLPYLARMRTPTLVIFGANDENHPAKRATELWRASQREIVLVPDTGHNLMVRQKDGYAYAPQYVEAMRKWLEARGLARKAF